jgi:hypothetical protein
MRGAQTGAPLTRPNQPVRESDRHALMIANVSNGLSSKHFEIDGG